MYFDDNGAEIVLPYVARYAPGPQDTRPLQSMLTRCEDMYAEIIARPVPDADMHIDLRDPDASLAAATPSARVALSFRYRSVPYGRRTIEAAMAVLHLDSLVSLTAGNDTRLSQQSWLHYAQRWPLLRSVRITPRAAHGFRETLLLHDDNGGDERPLLPSLTKLVLTGTELNKRRTLRLCDALRRRAERGFRWRLSTCARLSGVDTRSGC